MAKGDGKEFKGLVKIKKLLLEYANEKATEGKRKVADNIRFAVQEMENPKIVECAKIIMEDGVSASELFAIGMLGIFTSANE